MSKVPSRILAVVLGVFVGIVVDELALRAAGMFAANRLGDDIRNLDPTRPMAVFCGDSNVFGVYVNKEETLPKVVERLSQKDGAKGVRTLNFGVPGSATWNTLDQVRRALILKPAVVFVRCGLNNYSINPPDEGLGVLENLNIIKFVRRTWFNMKVREMRGNAIELRLGPGGAPIEGYHVGVDLKKSGVSVVDREGIPQLFSQGFSGTIALFPQIEARMRADFLAMQRETSAAGAKIVYITYLAEVEPTIHDVSNLMREVSKTTGAGLADCGLALAPAIAAGGPPAVDGALPWDFVACRRNALLTCDNHPSALGYEVEGRVVADALRTAGILNNYKSEDPNAPVASATFNFPTIRQISDSPSAGDGYVKLSIGNLLKGDQLKLFVGTKGAAPWNNLHLPIDGTQFEKLRGGYAVGDLKYEIRENGDMAVRLPRELLISLSKPILAIAAVERGGTAGAAQRFPSAALEIDASK
ncbi:MAG: SGNH/GDSL hydrolase family protein [Planctomycetes bacterium]|nr:SGNH/GDSL hydrolase family protein [Planctomycetota bacterium]